MNSLTETVHIRTSKKDLHRQEIHEVATDVMYAVVTHISFTFRSYKRAKCNYLNTRSASVLFESNRSKESLDALSVIATAYVMISIR